MKAPEFQAIGNIQATVIKKVRTRIIMIKGVTEKPVTE